MAARVAESRKYCGTVVEMNFLSRDTQRFVLRTIAVGDWRAIRRYMSNRVETAWLPEGLLKEQWGAFGIEKAGGRHERQPPELELRYADTSKIKAGAQTLAARNHGVSPNDEARSSKYLGRSPKSS